MIEQLSGRDGSMNKHEAIKKVEQMGEHERFVNESIPKLSVLNILNQLDEPQKPVVPQFVADWIEKCKSIKQFISSLAYALNSEVWSENSLSDDCIDWLYIAGNQDIFARAWLDGYTVEKEKRYLVKIKGVNPDSECLYFGLVTKTWRLEYEGTHGDFIKHHTRKELEQAGFGWVFDCPGIEIEEVEG